MNQVFSDDADDQIEAIRSLIVSGKIWLGMTRSEVRRLLGQPTDIGIGSRRYQAPRIYKYGKVELAFGPRYKHGLELVYVDSFDENVKVRVLLGPRRS